MKKYLTKVNLLMIVIIYIALRLTDFNQLMTSYWVGPYLSATVNFDWSTFSLFVNWDEIKIFTNLVANEMFQYQFVLTDNLAPYDYLAKGLVLILIFAKKLFFWQGDLEALQTLQYIVHISFSLFVMTQLLTHRYQKVLFLILYSLNPIILYFVNYPFYYFWQVIPSLLFIYWYFNQAKTGNLIYIFSIIFALIYLTRPTVLFLVILFYIFYSFKDSLKKALVGFFIFMILINLAPSLSIGPWHTMYVGIGAYPNDYGIELDDNSGYNYYNQIIGKEVNSANIMIADIKDDYYVLLKNRIIEIAKENPLMMVRNMTYNIAQSYSFGYSHSINQKVEGYWIVYISIAFGLIMMALLLYTKNYILFLAIGFAGGAFTPYYPPISPYMYGSYILIVIAIIRIVDFFIEKKRFIDVK